MARAPTAKDDDSGSSAQPEQKPSKRRCVQSACVPCRKRKSKCDGGTPVCATCSAVYNTPCFYDPESESRRAKAAPKRDHSNVSEQSNGSAEIILNSIRNLPEDEANEVIEQIRRNDTLDVNALAESLRRTVTLPPDNVHDKKSSLEGKLSNFIGEHQLSQSGVSRHFGHTSTLGLTVEDEDYTKPQTSSTSLPRRATWTNVTDDMNFIQGLLDLYFRWSHPLYVLFSRECFYKDFRHPTRQKYCSPLLVNAICAYSCHFSDDPKARTNPNDHRTAGDHFFAEARQLLFEDESPCLTTIQAMAVLGLREASAGRDSAGFMYEGRCFRMAIELGLHLHYPMSSASRLTPSEAEVRNVTFWGLFGVDTVWSLCVGRISQLPTAAINVKKPILNEPVLTSQIGCTSSSPQAPEGATTSRQFLQHFSTLSEIINDNVFLFYAPKERFTDRRLLDCYHKYKNWYKSLPKNLQLPEDETLVPPQPHIITLHMYYHTCLLHLFRPLLKMELIHSDIRPRAMCIDSANNISELLRLYRKHYSMRACHLLLTHIFLSTCIVHLIESTRSKTNAMYLTEGLRGLEALSTAHHFGARAFKIIWSLSQEWNLPFPEELKNSKLVPLREALITSPAPPSSFGVPTPTPLYEQGLHNYPPMVQLPPRRESLTMYSHSSEPSNMQPFTNGTFTSLPTTAMSTSSFASSGPASSEQLFWTPIEGIGVPLVARSHQQVSPMDLSNMLGGMNELEKLSRDGFKMSDSWPNGPLPFNDPLGHPTQTANAAGSGVYGDCWSNGAAGNGMT